MMIVWLVAIFGMFKINGSVERRITEESGTHPKKKSIIGRLPSSLVLMVIILATLFLSWKVLSFATGKYQDKRNDLDRKAEKIEADYKALDEDNTDPDTGKIILTENYLDKEYRLFFLNADKEINGTRVIGIIGLCLIVGIGSLTTVPYCIGAFYKKYRPVVPAVISLLLVLAILVGGLFAFDITYSYNLPPDPDEVTFEVYQVTAARYYSEHVDDEGNTSSSHWVGIDFGEGEVLYRGDKADFLIRSIGEDGQYFLARAKGKLRNYDFKCYPVNRFMPDNHL